MLQTYKTDRYIIPFHFRRTHILILILLVSINTFTLAQTPSDAIMMNKNELCILLSHTQGKFDQYWEGDLLRKNQTISTVQRKSVMPMAAFGVNNWLNAYIGLPYIWSYSDEPNGGKLHGTAGLQDITLALKAKILDKASGIGRMSILSSVGYSRPVTKYLGDYLPYSLGLGDQQLHLRAMAQYSLNAGPYLRLGGGHQIRGYSKAERDYYYNNGSVYSPYMDVPSAWIYEITLGSWLLDNQIKIEASYNGWESTSGDDIRKYNAAQPTNNTAASQVMGNLQFYPKFVKGFGIVLQYSDVLAGRNTAKMAAMTLGITYQFSVIKTQNPNN